MKVILLFVYLFICVNIENKIQTENKLDRCEPIPIYTNVDYRKIILHELQRREGLRLQKYICPAGYSTIGYGHVGKTVKSIKTKKDAIIQLEHDLDRYVEKVNKIYDNKLSSNESYALASLYMNLKYSKLKDSNLEKCIKQGKNPYKYWMQYIKYTTPTGVVRISTNLKRSRELEIYLFNINKNLQNEQRHLRFIPTR